MKNLMLAFLLFPLFCFGQTQNDLQVQQRNAANTAYVNYQYVEPTLDGLFGAYRKSTERPISVNFGSRVYINWGNTPPTIEVDTTGLAFLTDLADYALQVGLDDANVRIDDTEDAIDLLNTAVTTNTSDISSLTTTVAGKFAQPSGTTAQYLRGDGSLDTFPALFGGAYSSLTGIPSTFTPSAHNQAASTISDSTTVGRAVMTSTDAAAARSAIGAGTSSTAGTVTSVICGTGLSGGTITATGTCSLPNTGSASTYDSVTTDTQGRVTAGTTLSIAAPSRALVTTTSSTGFQVSATRPATVCYEGITQTTSTIGGPASGSVFLETANTNSSTPGDWTTIAEQTATNTITLAIALQAVDGESWGMCRTVAAAKYVRIRSQTNSGTVSSTINATQQEVTL